MGLVMWTFFLTMDFHIEVGIVRTTVIDRAIELLKLL